MKKSSLKNLHVSRGDVISDENSELEDLFNNQTSQISKAAQNLDKMSLAELKELAEDLGITPTDNKKQLVQLIKKQYKER